MSQKNKRIDNIIRNKLKEICTSSSDSDSEYETIDSSDEEEEKDTNTDSDEEETSLSERDTNTTRTESSESEDEPPRRRKKTEKHLHEKRAKSEKRAKNEKKQNNTKNKKKHNDEKHYNKKHHRKDDSEDEDDEDDDDYDEDDDKKEPMYSIIITPSSSSSSCVNNLGQDYVDYFGTNSCCGGEDVDNLENKEQPNEEYTSEDERNFMKENYEKIPISSNIEAILDKKGRKKLRDEHNDNNAKESKKQKYNKEQKDKETIVSPPVDVHEEYRELVELKKQLTEKLEKTPNNRILQHAVKDCKKSIKKLIKDARNENTNRYIKLLQKGGSQKMNEVDFFKKKMSNREQLRVMEELSAINNHIFVEKPYRLALLETKIPPKFKAIALQKLNVLKSMEPGDNEYYKIKTWVDTFMRIPFGIYRSLNVSIHDGIEACNDFITNSKNILDTCVYGHNDAKMQILQMVGQWMTNPCSMGTAIAIHGPAGVGKTLLVKEGISKIFGREFAFLALGGATDSSFLEGHSYTYEGSQWGRIVQILIDGKTMNPVIFFDELDKVSDTARGDEIIGILTHLTDTTQNSQFHDKYFSELEFDLSKCLFIFSYNDESKVNPILRDRMYVIHTKGYDVKDKIVITRKHLLPKIREQVSFNEDDVIISDDIIQYIVSNQDMTRNEEGVRNLKRCLEIIHTKLNLYRLIKPGCNIFRSNNSNEKDTIGLGLENVSFPYTVTRKCVDILIRNTDRAQNQSLLAMYV